MFGCGRNLGLGGLQKFLVSLVHEAGDFSANLDSRLGKEAGRAIVAALNGGRNARFFEEDTVFCAGSFQYVKAMIAKPIHSFFIRAVLCCCRHKPPDRGFDSKRERAVALETREWLMSHMESS